MISYDKLNPWVRVINGTCMVICSNGDTKVPPAIASADKVSRSNLVEGQWDCHAPF